MVGVSPQDSDFTLGLLCLLFEKPETSCGFVSWDFDDVSGFEHRCMAMTKRFSTKTEDSNDSTRPVEALSWHRGVRRPRWSLKNCSNASLLTKKGMERHGKADQGNSLPNDPSLESIRPFGDLGVHRIHQKMHPDCLVCRNERRTKYC